MSWLDQLFSASSHKQHLITPDEALPGRDTEIAVPGQHLVLRTPLRGRPGPGGTHANGGVGDFGDDKSMIVLAGGCFWGVEEIFWQVEGVYTTAVGYAGGFTPNPTYEETCTARTGHTESTLVVFDPGVVDLEGILKIFWESHDPTQEMRQGNDIGTQYRSAIYTFSDADLDVVKKTAVTFQSALDAADAGEIATEIKPLAEAGGGRFYYAEDYHQQYLAKNPHGYRCHSSTGIRYPA
ncbi:peptide-methionine (S)-S-oxide reductase MsrA [Gordonia aurantiaca]|uniref:peptide-methionine (S)-S-oxide reductase MsrA n=1 Tax=Gordonia sp. B21 TaxID=3151852 RepID=UPI0032655363